jgi:hypothetical protein
MNAFFGRTLSPSDFKSWTQSFGRQTLKESSDVLKALVVHEIIFQLKSSSM